jgi:hypothetical protein
MKRILRITRIELCAIGVPLAESFSFCCFVGQGQFGDLKHPERSSQKIRALVLRTLTPRGAIPNNPSKSEASV